MTKKELIREVGKANDLTQKVVGKVIDDLLTLIAEELAKGNKVVLLGFGTFEVKERKARNVRNPRTGELMITPAKKTPVFKAEKELKAKIFSDV